MSHVPWVNDLRSNREGGNPLYVNSDPSRRWGSEFGSEESSIDTVLTHIERVGFLLRSMHAPNGVVALEEAAKLVEAYRRLADLEDRLPSIMGWAVVRYSVDHSTGKPWPSGQLGERGHVWAAATTKERARRFRAILKRYWDTDLEQHSWWGPHKDRWEIELRAIRVRDFTHPDITDEQFAYQLLSTHGKLKGILTAEDLATTEVLA